MSLAVAPGTRAILAGAFTLVCSVATTPGASAGPILSDIWYEFSFLSEGLPAMGCDPADPLGLICTPSSETPTQPADAPPWTITLGSPGGIFTVTHAFNIGDRFEVFDFGGSLGVTSPPIGVGTCGDDPLACLADPTVSHGTFTLGQGAHSLTIVPTIAPLGGGAAYFRLDDQPPAPAIPEPASLALLATGLALGLRRLRPPHAL